MKEKKKRQYRIKIPLLAPGVTCIEEEVLVDTRRDILLKIPGSMCGPVCDGCNAYLPSEPWLLVLDLRPWGALCDKCANEYHSKLPRYKLVETVEGKKAVPIE